MDYNTVVAVAKSMVLTLRSHVRSGSQEKEYKN
jgi:hypothetical protein